jgi:hypothetical protein
LAHARVVQDLNPNVGNAPLRGFVEFSLPDAKEARLFQRTLLAAEKERDVLVRLRLQEPNAWQLKAHDCIGHCIDVAGAGGKSFLYPPAEVIANPKAFLTWIAGQLDGTVVLK